MSRAVRLALAAVVFVAVCLATLTPSTSSVTADFWCIACGEFGGLDVVANVVMFLPLGLTLALALGRRRPVMLICIATTLAVELLQVRVVPGRDASLSDLLANTLGAWIGTELAVQWPTLAWPSPRVARRLAIVWSCFVALVLAGTSWGLGPAFVPRSLWIQRLPPRTPYVPFTGRLLAFDIDGIDLTTRFPKVALQIDRHLQSDSWAATAVVDTKGLLPTRSIIVRVAEEFTVLVWLDQIGWDVTCLQKTRSAMLRLRSPKGALVGGLRPASPTDTLARLTCARRPGALEARVSRDNETRTYSMRLSPSLGWLLMSPFNFAFDDRYRVVSALWLVALLAPAGYWAGAARRRSPIAGPGATPRREGRALGTIGFSAALAALVVGLAVAPRVFHVAVGAWWEWAAGLAAIALGAALHRVVDTQGPAESVDLSIIRHDAA